MTRACVLFFVLAAALAGTASAQGACKDACHPWIAGQKCTRKTGKIDIRFGLELPGVSKDGVTYISYGFCANVDELQSFQLNYSLASVALNKTLKTGDPSYNFTEQNADLWMWGAGTQNNVEFPGPLNDSSVWAYEGDSEKCDSQPAVVSMLIYNITLNMGKFEYENGVPVGVGFAPTCGSDDVCKMDPALKCIGHTPGAMNCATCLSRTDPRSVIGKDIVIFTTYYGTDSRGKTLLSGSSNPLNFRAFAMGGAYNSIATDMANLDHGVSNANPFADVDSYTWEGFGKTKLATNVPNNAINGGG